MINNISLIGRLVADPSLVTQLDEKQEAQSLTCFTLAVNRGFSRDKTDFISCRITGELSHRFVKDCFKGYLVSLSGNIYTEILTRPDGTNIKELFIQVREYTVLSVPGKKRNKNNSSGDTIDDLPY